MNLESHFVLSTMIFNHSDIQRRTLSLPSSHDNDLKLVIIFDWSIDCFLCTHIRSCLYAIGYVNNVRLIGSDRSVKWFSFLQEVISNLEYKIFIETSRMFVVFTTCRYARRIGIHLYSVFLINTLFVLMVL